MVKTITTKQLPALCKNKEIAEFMDLVKAFDSGQEGIIGGTGSTRWGRKNTWEGT